MLGFSCFGFRVISKSSFPRKWESSPWGSGNIQKSSENSEVLDSRVRGNDEVSDGIGCFGGLQTALPAPFRVRSLPAGGGIGNKKPHGRNRAGKDSRARQAGNARPGYFSWATYWRKTSLMRVCQPLPPARNFSTTSADRRMVTSCFV